MKTRQSRAKSGWAVFMSLKRGGVLPDEILEVRRIRSDRLDSRTGMERGRVFGMECVDEISHGQAMGANHMKGHILKVVATAMLWMLCHVAYAGAVTYVYTDPQGTPLAEADASGNITARFEYTPYGVSVSSMGAAPDGPGYTGHVNDPDSGFVYMQARYYDPATERFLSVDPIGLTPGGLFNYNRYAYANGNPYRYIDPDGRCTGSLISNSDGTCASTGTYTTTPTAASTTAVRAFNIGRKAYIQYADGATEVRTGSRPWRDNNPGDLRMGSKKSASSKMALGWDYSLTGPNDKVTPKQPFAIFSSAAVGDRALQSTLLSVYGNDTIGEAIQRFAPSSDFNNPAHYASFIMSHTGAPAGAAINSLTPSQLSGTVEAIKAVEGFNNGGSAVIYTGLGPFSQ